MAEYGIYVGKKTGKKSKRSRVALWRWGLVHRTSVKPSVATIRQWIRKKNGLKGYAMRLKPRPWKKVSITVSK